MTQAIFNSKAASWLLQYTCKDAYYSFQIIGMNKLKECPS